MYKRIAYLLTISLFALSAPLALAAVDNLKQSLASDQRKAEDKERDAGRKPAEVLAYLGVEPGMTVLDIMASGGWYTEALSFAVGEEGTVIAHNTPGALQFRDGAYEKAISERLADDRLPNVERLNKDFDELGLENEVDVAITALNFHDIYNRNPDNAVAMLESIKKALKPGGVLGVIDHDGDADKDNSSLHRMTMEDAVAAAKEAGFEVASSDILRNPDDDHSKMVFDSSIRGKTDRFLLKLTIPE